MAHEFATAQRILFGRGVLAEAGPVCAGLGKRALLVTGSYPGRAAGAAESLGAAGVVVAAFSVSGEPTVQDVRNGVAAARVADCDLVVGIGGGSVLDAAKGIAAILGAGGDPLDYLEVVGAGKPLPARSAPCVAIPTTAGTGAEVTRNAVLGSPEHGVKASLRGLQVLPRAAIVDPECTYGLPPEATAYSGMDAVTQLLEAFTSRRASPLTDPFCREGLARAARSLRNAYEGGDVPAAREDMSLAALFGGLALANAGLGAVHGFAGPLGGMCPGPHGALCARLVPYVVDANIAALRGREPESPVLARYAEAAGILTGVSGAAPEDAATWLSALASALRVPSLRSWGLRAAQHEELVGKAKRASSMKANPITLTDEELLAVVKRAE